MRAEAGRRDVLADGLQGAEDAARRLVVDRHHDGGLAAERRRQRRRLGGEEHQPDEAHDGAGEGQGDPGEVGDEQRHQDPLQQRHVADVDDARTSPRCRRPSSASAAAEHDQAGQPGHGAVAGAGPAAARPRASKWRSDCVGIVERALGRHGRHGEDRVEVHHRPVLRLPGAWRSVPRPSGRPSIEPCLARRVCRPVSSTSRSSDSVSPPKSRSNRTRQVLRSRDSERPRRHHGADRGREHRLHVGDARRVGEDRRR